MSVRKRLPIALILLGLVFVWVQFFSNPLFFIALQMLILVTLAEFYNLSRKRQLNTQAIAGCVLALIISCSFFFEIFSLRLTLFVCLLLIGMYYVVYINRLEKLPTFASSLALTFFGAVYVSFTLNHFYLIKVERGAYTIYFFLMIVFVGDTGAYIFGKLLGKRKVLPVASPRKTWVGCFGGVLFASLTAWAAQHLLIPELLVWKAVVCGLAVHVVAQISDPLESLFKRAAGVKDSSRLLLGHGGFLDRMDSFLLATPFFYYFISYVW